jgi:hypothetical protein
MKIQPRYSLFALLAFTAVVGLGVKLWYGPHHVIERPSPNLEDEYTYTRDWSGIKIVQGPRLLRYHKPEGTLDHVMIEYYRQGVNLKQAFEIFALRQNELLHAEVFREKPQPLNFDEELEFKKAIEQEEKSIQKLGLVPGYPYYEDL